MFPQSSGYRRTPLSCELRLPASVTPVYMQYRLGGDLLAGLTVASMLIPQSISYASSLAKLSPVTGLVSSASFIP
jgi:MFS superfamily sulfate permease-like transporter